MAILYKSYRGLSRSTLSHIVRFDINSTYKKSHI